MKNFIKKLAGSLKSKVQTSKKQENGFASALDAASDNVSIENITGNGAANNEVKSTKQLKSKQILYVIFGILVVIATAFLLVKLKLPTKSSNNTPKVQAEQDNNSFKVELATASVKGEKKYLSYLEDKIDEEQKSRDKQLKLLENSIIEKDAEIKNTQTSEFQEIKARLSFALNELDRLKSENNSIRDEMAMISGKEEDIVLPAQLGLTSTYEMNNISGPESTFNYIPATAYVTGKLLGGIAVDTSISTRSRPKPVTIRLEGRGNLPKAFAVDIKQCRILAACYGVLSSERADIRAEKLVCEDKARGLVTTTEIAGIVHGDDGMDGIKGEVVSMAEKHLKSAFISGVLSGFSQTVKGENSLNISSLGALSTKKRGVGEMAKDSLMSGTSTSAEMLAEYRIKLAESISPVILIPGGTRVDVSFTEGVHIGQIGLREKFAKARKKKE